MAKAKITKKKKKKKPFIYRLFSWILIIISLFLIGSIIYLNVLNIPLLILVMFLIFIVDGFIILLMLRSKKKKMGFGISVILILLFSLLSFYINKTTGLLSNLNLNYKTYNYSVVVLKTSPYEKIKELDGKNIGYFDDGSVENDKALNKVLGKTELESTSYEDTHALANALLEEKEAAILIEDSYLEILSESITDEKGSFGDKIKKIYSFTIVTKTSDIAKDINVTKEPFNIYVSGIDTYGEISSVSRSDVNMIVSVNPATQQILLTSIPRDYYVKLHGKSGYRDKLTHAGLYGTDMSIQTIEDLLDIEINYYVKVNFSSVINIVDAIGGVNVYSDYTFTSIDNYSYKEGYNAVNGEEALSFARERKAFAIGDRQRVKNQQALLRAIFDKCTSKAIITKYSKLLDSMSGSFVTNMKMSRLTSLVRLQLSKNYSWNLVTNSLMGEDSSNYTYSAPSQKAYVMVPDEESVSYASELVKAVLTGEILDEEKMESISEEVHKVTKQSTSSITSNSFNDKAKEEDSKNTDIDSSKDNQDDIEEEGLEAKLGKTSVTFVEGDEYVYYGYTATYNGTDVTDDSNLKVKFSVNGKIFDDYRDLVSYITNSLDPGEYTVIYTISYKGKSTILDQSVIIEELPFNSDDDEDNYEIDVTDKDLNNKKDNVDDSKNESNDTENSIIEE